MSDLDVMTKAYVNGNEVFADLFNHLLYEGKAVIKAENLQAKDPTELLLLKNAGKAAQVQRFRDVLKQVVVKQDNNACYSLVLGIEAQSRVHYAMVVRNMIYDSLNYGSQVNGLSQKNREQGELNGSAEFLSGIRKTDKLVPVITLVVNFSTESWDGAKSLHELFADKNQVIDRYVPDYRLNLISPMDMEDGDIASFKTDFKELAAFLKSAKDKEAMHKLLENDKYRSMDALTGSLIAKIGKLKKLPEVNEKGEMNMCKAFEDYKKEGEIQGEKQGLEIYAMLISKLRSAGRIEDVFKSCEDAEYRQELLAEFGLLN